MSRREIVIIAISAVLLVGIVVFLLLQNKSSEVSIESVEQPGASSVSGIQIDNTEQYSDRFKEEYARDASVQIAKYLELSKVKNTANARGVIREGTFVQSSTEFGAVTNMLIDFPELKRSYKVTYGEDTTGYRAVTVLCPNQAERIYPETECVDSVDE